MADSPRPFRRAPADEGTAVEPQQATARRLEAGNEAQERALARAVAPDQRDPLAGACVEGDSFQDRGGALAARDAGEGKAHLHASGWLTRLATSGCLPCPLRPAGSCSHRRPAPACGRTT